MDKKTINLLVSTIFALMMSVMVSAQPLLSAAEIGFDQQSRDSNYDALVDAFFSNNNVVTTVNGDKMWVPWYKTSSGSQASDLQDGGNCNSGQTIDYSHNCMVTDEYSQVGIMVSMGKSQERMDQFYNTVLATKSSFGNIPSWRIYRDGDRIEACRPGINSNCDTASDGTARIIIALFTASKNPLFTDEAQKTKYAELARKLSDDMLTYEVDTTCRQTKFGEVCNWLAGGAQAKIGGIGTYSFTYTGYFPDAIIAMLQAYSATGDQKYLVAAEDFTLNYMQAADFTSGKLSVPPGMSFKWVVDSKGIPRAECTRSCEPVIWDGFDASRALGMCQANYYAKEMGVNLPHLEEYCTLLDQQHMDNPTSCPLQFKPDGSAGPSQSGYFAQGLQALHLSGVDPAAFKQALDSALSHYSSRTKTFDNAPSIGVYTQAFAVRALGMGIGRDEESFGMDGQTAPEQKEIVAPTPEQNAPAPEQVFTPAPIVNPPTTPSTGDAPQKISYGGIETLRARCTYGHSDKLAGIRSDSTKGSCRTVVFATDRGDIKMFGCDKDNGQVELYKQEAPNGLDFQACLSDGCIYRKNGFARFTPYEVTNDKSAPEPQEQTTEPVEAEPVEKPVVSEPETQPVEEKPAATGLAALSLSCKIGSETCSPKSDSADGGCRTVVFGSSSGDIQTKACDKGSSVEVYRQNFPAGSDFEACMGPGCVDELKGFASFPR
jgi:hypothetical protein